jgi:hypothetical protein
MATRANAADLVFAGCLCLVALALLMLGWQIIHTLAWFSPPTPVTQAGSRSPQALLFIGVAAASSWPFSGPCSTNGARGSALKCGWNAWPTDCPAASMS